MTNPTVHVIGAGLAGLSAALALASKGTRVALYEAAGQAGGRCRSYHEPALDMEIDNGNHLVLSGNRATMRYADMLGTRGELVGPAKAEFEFFDLTTGERWRLRPNPGRLPRWIFNPKRRVPGTRGLDYLSLAKLLFAKKNATIGDTMPCSGLLYDRLWRPILLAALNTDPKEASAALAAAVIRESLALGGNASRPLIAKNGLSHAFIDPALAKLETLGGTVSFGRRLRAIRIDAGRAAALDFGEGPIALGTGDRVVLATPASVAAGLLPDLIAPTEHRSIINGHFRAEAPPGTPAMLGMINSTVEWVFVFPGRISITVSGADHLLDVPREELAETFWREIKAATGLDGNPPRWQVIKEKRATFAATPSENAKRPKAATAWKNLVLAGDYTATGLPATIEGAIRSGFQAADLTQSALRSSIQ